MEVKNYFVAALIIVLALLAGVVSAYQYIESSKKDKKDSENTNKLIDAQEKALKATGEISATQKQALDVSNELKLSQQDNISKTEKLAEAQKKINELQGEMLKQVIGSGYPKLKIMNSLGNNFQFFIEPSTGYPIYQTNLRISDAAKMKQCPFETVGKTTNIDKTCYDKCELFKSSQPFDMIGSLMNLIEFILPKKSYYLVTEFMAKNVTCIQYSILKYENGKVKHSYRIYEVSKENNSVLELLEDNDPIINESEYEKNFFFKKKIVVDFAK